MIIETHQRGKIVPESRDTLSAYAHAFGNKCSGRVALCPWPRATAQSGFIRPRYVLCIAGAMAVISITSAVLLSSQSSSVSDKKDEVELRNGHAANSTTLTSQQVLPHPVLPVAVQGKAQQQTLKPASIRQALYGKEFSFDSRIRYIDDFSPALAPEDIRILLDYTKQPIPDDGLKPAQRLGFKNDIIFALRSQKNPPLELTALLVGIYSDKKQEIAMRDYAIQHISEWRWRAVRRDPDAARNIDAALWSAAGETRQSYAGTALLALARLVADTKMPDHASYAADYQQRLSQAALALASDEKAALPARVTAIGLCARTRTVETTGLITGILSQSAPPPTLQLAALGALTQTLPAGSPLEPQTRALLERAARSAYPPVQKLASNTLRNHTF